jgi:hypothetical protein
MAYQVVDSFRTVETFGGLDSRDVQRVIVRALPSGVSFGVQFTANEQTFNDPEMLGRATAAIANPYVGYIDEALAMPTVSGIYSYEDFNASNTVENRWVVTITSNDGTLSTQRDIAFTDIIPERLEPIVRATTATLEALQGSGRPDA